MGTTDELQDWQKNIIGLMFGWGKVVPAARAALDRGEDGVIFAMDVAIRYGREEAMREIASFAKSKTNEHLHGTWDDDPTAGELPY